MQAPLISASLMIRQYDLPPEVEKAWMYWMLKKEVLAAASLAMIVLGSILHMSGSQSVLAKNISLLWTSVLVSGQVNSVESMECAVKALKDNDLSFTYSIQFRIIVSAWLGENDIKFTFDGFCQIQEGKIVEWWSEYDALSMMQQLGMEFKPKEIEK